ncbi:hypothetical protein CKM354_001199800 [Cercospora kikuchii]|uniref:Uncharacterized protein n=1 Tax=Cercospora kikuchii TaxID=84275 RepID=A0A9P3CZA5_9PEZI|nr:uncharacterized protein CKM354_001199800 [Cercospora kikuchii]GIZ48955.1 hypothetical protein CKM354_001199800 [Cercospora kikuchii]
MDSPTSTTSALTSTTEAATESFTSRPRPENCSVSDIRLPSTFGSYCLAARGHPRMRTCCELYGFSNEIEILQQCHTWCMMNDDAFPDDAASSDGTRRGVRLRTFGNCLVNGTDGLGEFIQPPQLLECNFNDLSGRQSVTPPGWNNDTSTGNSATVLESGGGIGHFFIMVALILVGLR